MFLVIIIHLVCIPFVMKLFDLTGIKFSNLIIRDVKKIMRTSARQKMRE